MLAMISDDRNFNGNWNATSPGSLTELFDVSFNATLDMGIGAAWAIKSSAGSTGNGAVTLSGNARDGAILIALKAAPPGSTQAVSFTSSGTFEVPNCVTSLTVEAWGAGGGGFNGSNSGGGKGGGGGGYAKGTIANASGSYSVVVGIGGAENANGTASVFGSNLIVADYGRGGTSTTTGGGAGGSSNTGNLATANGGTGGNGNTTNDVGGGGGGAAGPNGNGVNGANGANSLGGNGGNGNNGSGGIGGIGGSGDGVNGSSDVLGGGGGGGGADSSIGGNGGFPGGGGGGGKDGGGSGANGWVIVSYTLPNNPTITLTNTTTTTCYSASAQNVTLAYSTTTGCPDKYSIDFTSGIADVIDANLSGSPLAITLPANLSAGNYTGTLTVKNSTYGFESSGYSITITVINGNTVGTASSTPTLCINTVLSNITHVTTGATGIGTPTGLPTGVTASWASNTITISGTPTATGTFNYSIPLSGGVTGCPIFATGSIVVLSNNTITLTSAAATANQTQTAGSAITNITYATTVATGATVSGLPTGVTANWAANVLTISGTPTSAGTFNYTVTMTGGCTGGTNTATGTITVTPNAIFLTTMDAQSCQDFNSLPTTGTSSVLPLGWYFSESGTNGNTTITAANGSSNVGDTYNLGATGNTDRTLGGLLSTTVFPRYGAQLLNNTANTISILTISYTGETWRVGAAGRSDRIDFQYSTDASSLTSGSWVDENNLDYSNPGQSTGNGSVQHSANISFTIKNLSIAPGASFWIRWTDLDVAGNDDAMGVDDVCITPVTPCTPSVSIASSDADNSICLGSSVTFNATPTNGGSIPAYQWKLNGTNVGTNSATYTNAALADNDVVAVVMTSNAACASPATATSNAVTIDIQTSLLTTTGASNCGTGNLTVSASSSCNVPGSSISWFANATGGNALATTSSYTANYTASTTVYAQENFVGGETVYGNDNTGTANRGLQFTLYTDITLNSVNIESDGTANITIQLWNAATNAPLVVNGNTYSTTVAVVNGNNVETLGWFIPAGVGYRLVVTNMGGRNLTRTPNFTFPESLPGVGSITGNVDTGGTDRYNFFYNWNYSTVRVPATVTITTPVTPSVTVTSSDVDNSICSGTNVTFTATPTNGGSTPAYQWKLNGTNVGSDATTYTIASLANGDVVTVVMTANNVCQTASTANGNSISTSVLANNNYYADADGDTYGPTSSLVVTCIMPAGYTTESGDCDDTNSEAYPFNLEICNGIDDDCSGAADNGLTSYTFYADQDGDGYGSNSATIVSCDFVAGYLMTNGDCNDALSTVNPQASELCSTSYDDDCDGLINEVCNISNDDPLFSNLIIPATSLVNCNTVTGSLNGSSPSTQVGVETLTGAVPDTWYYFTASSPGITIRCIPTNDVKLELRTGAGLLLKSANAVNGIGDEYLNYGELTVGGQYYVRVMQMDSPSLGGTFTLCSRRINSSGNLNYTNSILYDSGCDVVYATNTIGSNSSTIQLTPIMPSGGAVLTSSGPTSLLSNFIGPNGEKVSYNTLYSATITLNYTLPTGGGGSESISVARVTDNQLNVVSHVDLNLGSVHACPARVSIGGTVRANIWLCDAVRYQWKFEKTVNGILQLVNGNPVVIEVYGPLGTRDFIPTATMGFTAGSEWRVQVRPVFANGVVGSYGTNYQCMKFKGTAAAMPTVEDESDLEKALDNLNDVALMLYPNPSGRTSVNVIWNADESEDVQLIVRDMQGRVVQRIEHIQGNQFAIDGSDLSGGMYWVEWHSGANTQRLRWMIQ